MLTCALQPCLELHQLRPVDPSPPIEGRFPLDEPSGGCLEPCLDSGQRVEGSFSAGGKAGAFRAG